MSIKRFLARLVQKITGRKCCRCRYNIGGACTHPSDGMFMRCWHGITQPGYEERPAKAAPGNLIVEERYQLEQIVASLKEASATARDGGLLED